MHVVEHGRNAPFTFCPCIKRVCVTQCDPVHRVISSSGCTGQSWPNVHVPMNKPHVIVDRDSIGRMGETKRTHPHWLSAAKIMRFSTLVQRDIRNNKREAGKETTVPFRQGSLVAPIRERHEGRGLQCSYIRYDCVPFFYIQRI